jgi:selenocysteine lyase/cysteine desulfurase
MPTPSHPAHDEPVTTTRRTLLSAGLAGGAALAVAGCDDDDREPRATTTATARATATASGSSPPPAFDPQDWGSVKDQFLLDPSMAQLAAFVLSPHTRVLDAAITGYRDELGTDTETALLAGLDREDATRRAAAAYHGGVANQYALTDSTTMGLGLMYGGLSLGPGDEVLTTTHDFFSTEDSLRLLRQRTGARVSQVSLYDDPARATVDEMVDRLVSGITSRTRVVALTWVHSSTGVRVPVQEICAALASLSRVPRSQYVVCVDGVHGFSAVDVDLADLGCDFLAAGTHKWLFGPRGTGVLWGRDWGPLREVIPSFSDPGSPAGRLTPGGYHSFEHRWALADAFGFMDGIGRDRVVARTVAMATQLKEGLAGLPGVTLRTPADPAVSAGIVCFEVEGYSPPDAVYRLRDAKVVGSSTPYRTSYVRLGPSIATDPGQVDQAVEAVSRL